MVKRDTIPDSIELKTSQTLSSKATATQSLWDIAQVHNPLPKALKPDMFWKQSASNFRKAIHCFYSIAYPTQPSMGQPTLKDTNIVAKQMHSHPEWNK